MNLDYFKKRLNLFVALAPPTRISNTEAFALHLITKELDIIEEILVDDLGLYNIFPPNFLEDNLVAKFCEIELDLCKAILELFADADSSVDNLDRVKSFLTHMPSGTGYRNLLHYGQIINSDRFQRYDFGNQENLKRYGVSQPPIYEL